MSIHFYFAKIKWWSEYLPNDADDATATCIVAASSYDTAMKKISRRFPHIISLSIEEYEDDTDFMFVTSKTYNKLITRNHFTNEEEEII